MNTWKVILAALVIFGAGLVTGTVWTKARQSDQAKVNSSPTPANPRDPKGTARPPLQLEQLKKVELMMRVQKELNLTPEQRERIEKVITDGQEHIRDLWNQVAPDIQDELQIVKENLCKELTPEQKQRFDELMKRPPHHKSSGTNAAPPTAIAPEAVPAPAGQS